MDSSMRRKEARMELRDADAEDLPAILAIYNEVILNSTAVYAEDIVDLADRQAWFEARRRAGFPVLVAATDREVLGFGSFGDWRPWPCYAATVEHSVHVRADRRGRGIGRAIVAELVEQARGAGKHVILGGIDADNAASIGLHRSLGFDEAARHREVGRKFGRWLDLVIMERRL
jgi:L-amino acid N-acyltransferase YncA